MNKNNGQATEGKTMEVHSLIARRVALTDQEGRERLVLEVDNFGGNPAVTFYNKKGISNVSLCLFDIGAEHEIEETNNFTLFIIDDEENTLLSAGIFSRPEGKTFEFDLPGHERIQKIIGKDTADVSKMAIPLCIKTFASAPPEMIRGIQNVLRKHGFSLMSADSTIPAA